MTHPIRRTSAVWLQICFHHFWVAFLATTWGESSSKPKQWCWGAAEIAGQGSKIEVGWKWWSYLGIYGHDKNKMMRICCHIYIWLYMVMIRIMLHSQKNHPQKNHPKSMPKKIIPKVCPKKSSNQHLGHVLLGYFTGCRLSSPLRLAAWRCTTEMGSLSIAMFH